MFPFLCTPILVIPLLAQRPFKESNAYNKRLSICSGACPFYRSIPAAGTKRRSAPASLSRACVFFAALFLGGARNLSSTFSSNHTHFC